MKQLQSPHLIPLDPSVRFPYPSSAFELLMLQSTSSFPLL